MSKNLPVILIWILVFFGSQGSLGAQQERIPVTASIVPLGEFCHQIGLDRVEVQVLIPPGASPHTFEPPPSVVARAAKARVFLYIGEGLEPWAARLSRSLGKGSVALEAAQGLPLIRDTHGQGTQGSGHGKGKHSSSHSHVAGANPHVWLDPVLAQEICRKIAQALIQVDPAQREYYQKNLENYLGKLEALHKEIEERVSGFRIRKYVCFHPAYAYFSRRYGLEEVGVIELSPGREPSPKHLRDLVAQIRRHQIQVIFAEPQLSPRVAEAIAQEASVRVAMLDPLGGRPPYGSDYLALMRHNLQVMSESMGDGR